MSAVATEPAQDSHSALRALLARQPIFDRDLNVYAYELLFRSDEQNQAVFTDGDAATSQTIVNAFLELGLDQVVGDRLAFINLTRKFLTNPEILVSLKKRVVLEVLEDIDPDQEVVTALRRLFIAGFSIALDDFVFRDEMYPLVRLAHIIKVDVRQWSPAELAAQVAKLSRYGSALLAEKVETHAEFDYCKELGFRYFQGYFLSRPNIVQGARPPTNKLAILELVSKIQDPDIELHELERIIKHDVSLSYRILNFINSASAGMTQRVDSIRDAILLTGLRRIRIWVSMLLLCKLDDKPSELLRTALVRARMCELLGGDAPEQFFTVGLFSTLDALLDCELPQAVAALRLEGSLTDALLSHRGVTGEALASVLAWERGEVEQAIRLGYPMEILRQAYVDALLWADQSAQVVRQD